MKVKMLVTVKGSPDHIRVVEYKEGEVYDLPEDLAEAFIKAKFAKEVKEGGRKANKQKPDKKALEGAPENKAVKQNEG